MYGGVGKRWFHSRWSKSQYSGVRDLDNPMPEGALSLTTKPECATRRKSSGADGEPRPSTTVPGLVRGAIKAWPHYWWW